MTGQSVQYSSTTPNCKTIIMLIATNDEQIKALKSNYEPTETQAPLPMTTINMAARHLNL